MRDSFEFSSQLLEAYAKKLNWKFKSKGDEGQLFFKELDDKQFFLPIPFKSSKDIYAYYSQISRLAEAEHRSESSIILDLENFDRDVIRFRGDNKEWIDNAIPLKSGAGLFGTAYNMFRAIATTSRNPKGFIGSSYSKKGEILISNMYLGQSERGSYILPILVPLTIENQNQELANDDEKFGWFNFSSMPMERKVTSSLSQALHAIDNLVIRPARRPNVDEEIALIQSGVSHELLLSISNFLSQPTVKQFDIGFDWAYSIEVPVGVVSKIEFDSNAVGLLNEVANRLKQRPPLKREIVVGEIVTLHRPIEEDANYVIIETIRNGRKSKIYVDIDNNQYELALDYAKQHRPVIVEGDIIANHGKPPRIISPKRFMALDQTVLPAG